MSERLARAAGVLVVVTTLCVACGDGSTGPGGAFGSLQIGVAPVDGGQGQSALRGTSLPSPLRARVTTGTGAPVAGQVVTWFTTSGTLTPGGVTDADGIATATWQLGQAGPVNAIATLAGGARVTFTATADPAELEVLGGNDQVTEAGTSLPELVRVRVSYHGVPLPGEALQWSGAGQFIPSGPTDANGLASAEWGLGTVAAPAVGRVRVVADAISLGVPLRALVTPGAAADVVDLRVNDFWQLVGGGSPLTILGQLVDQYGNGIAGVPIAWEVLAGNGTLRQFGSTSGANGEIRASFEAATSEAFQVRLDVEGLSPIVMPVVELYDIWAGCDYYYGCYVLPVGTGTWASGYTIRARLTGACRLPDGTEVEGAGETYTLAIPGPGSYALACTWGGSFGGIVTLEITP